MSTYDVLQEGYDWAHTPSADYAAGADSAFTHAARKIDGSLPTAGEVGEFLSEWLDDEAPINQKRFELAALHLAKRYPAIGIIW